MRWLRWVVLSVVAAACGCDNPWSPEDPRGVNVVLALAAPATSQESDPVNVVLTMRNDTAETFAGYEVIWTATANGEDLHVAHDSAAGPHAPGSTVTFNWDTPMVDYRCREMRIEVMGFVDSVDGEEVRPAVNTREAVVVLVD